MIKKLSKYGNSMAIIIDKPILELLGISEDTPLKIKTDGTRITIEPIIAKTPRKKQPPKQTKTQKSYAKIKKKYDEAFKALAKK